MVAATSLALVGGLVAGCAAPAPVRDSARAAVARFFADLRRHDGAGACQELAPATRHEVEQSAKAPCEKAILDEDLKDARPAEHTFVYGQQAMIRMAHDTVFLANTATGWKVVAAGCIHQQPGPYDCELKGG